MLGQLTGEEEPDSSLDLPGGDGGPLVDMGKPRELVRIKPEARKWEYTHDASLAVKNVVKKPGDSGPAGPLPG